MEEKRQDFYFDFLLVGLIVLVAILLALSFFNAQQQAYSLLFFEGQPQETVIVGKALAVDFFIENHEGEATDYSYSIIAEGETKIQKTITVGNSEKKKLTESISFKAASSEKQKVLVQLQKPDSEQPYEIFFWVSVGQ